MKTPMTAKVLGITALAIACLTGCAHRYELVLNNALKVTTLGKPKLVNGEYVFKDTQGQMQTIPAGRVREINAK